jgi:outer membrane lipoprotein-sorting protein
LGKLALKMRRIMTEHCHVRSDQVSRDGLFLRRGRGRRWLGAAWVAGLLTAGALLRCPGWGAETNAPTAKAFADEAAAHKLYSKMVSTMRQAASLSWVSDYRWEARGQTLGHATYRIWLKKPNFARLEATPVGQTEASGILVGDGDYFWTYWPKEKPRYQFENNGKYAEEYEKYRRTFYMKERTPVGQHSIGHAAANLGGGLFMTIIDPSTFHGYTDSLQPYLDGVRSVGVEEAGGETCDVIEASFMKYQRSWKLWLSRTNHLPRKLTQMVRVSAPISFEETWSDVAINPGIANERFVWSAPRDWKEWRLPDIEEGLLKPGTVAPDFELASVAGGRLKLSNFRGQIVWLNVWRCG